MKIVKWIISLFRSRNQAGNIQPSPSSIPSPYARINPDEAAEDRAPSPETRPQVRDAFVFEGTTSKDEVQPERDTVGLWYPRKKTVVLRDPVTGATGRLIHWKESRRFIPLFGNWLGDGVDRLASYDSSNGIFNFWLDEEAEEPKMSFPYGPPDAKTWLPIAGDWIGKGSDGVGVYETQSCTFMLRNELIGGRADYSFSFAPAGSRQIPIAGDWNGDGKDGVGAYDPETGTFYLKDELSRGDPDYEVMVPLAKPDWKPVVGDWQGLGRDSVGVYDPDSGNFFLSHDVNSELEEVILFGNTAEESVPISARWISLAKS